MNNNNKKQLLNNNMNKELLQIHSRLSKLHKYLVESIRDDNSLQMTSKFGQKENLITFETSSIYDESTILVRSSTKKLKNRRKSNRKY